MFFSGNLTVKWYSEMWSEIAQFEQNVQTKISPRNEKSFHKDPNYKIVYVFSWYLRFTFNSWFWFFSFRVWVIDAFIPKNVQHIGFVVKWVCKERKEFPFFRVGLLTSLLWHMYVYMFVCHVFTPILNNKNGIYQQPKFRLKIQEKW